MTNITAAVGGTDNVPYGEARDRFAELLLCRGRMITQADFEAVVKAFAPKVREVKISPALRLRSSGLRRVQCVTIALERESFVDPEVESFILQRELERHLQDRALIDIEIQVGIEWVTNGQK
jgi:hypothetical protein